MKRCVLYQMSLCITVTKTWRLVQSYLQLVLINPDIKYPAAYLFSRDKKNSVFCLSFVYTLELINKEISTPTEMLIFHLKETGKKILKITLCYHHLIVEERGRERRLLSRRGGINGVISHPSSYLNPSLLSKHPLPPSTMNLSVLFFPATIS